MAGNTCDVCGGTPVIGVAASAFGPISFAYCLECLKAQREPYWAMIAGLTGLESLDEIREELHPYIHATLKKEGKSVEDFYADLKAAAQEYADWWQGKTNR